MPSDLKNYFVFLTETLGVKSFFDIDAGHQGKINDPEEPVLYAFFVEDLSHYSKDEKELLFKMISALEKAGSLNEKDCQVFDKNRELTIQAKNKIYFIEEVNNKSDNQVYSPRLLLSKPELKKKAWEDMKRILQIG